MKLTILTICFLLASALTKAQQIAITIEVQNIQIGKGIVVVNLYDKAENFFKIFYVSKSAKASSETLKFSLEIPNGTYAIAIYQDIDNNGKLNQGWFDIPLEPIGLGNNYKPNFSSPTFKECAVNISKTNDQFTIKLH